MIEATVEFPLVLREVLLLFILLLRLLPPLRLPHVEKKRLLLCVCQEDFCRN